MKCGTFIACSRFQKKRNIYDFLAQGNRCTIQSFVGCHCTNDLPSWVFLLKTMVTVRRSLLYEWFTEIFSSEGHGFLSDVKLPTEDPSICIGGEEVARGKFVLVGRLPLGSVSQRRLLAPAGDCLQRAADTRDDWGLNSGEIGVPTKT